MQFRQRFLSLVNVGLHPAIIRLSTLIHEGEQRYKQCIIVGDPSGGRHDNLVSSLCDPPFEKSWLRPCSAVAESEKRQVLTPSFEAMLSAHISAKSLPSTPK